MLAIVRHLVVGEYKLDRRPKDDLGEEEDDDATFVSIVAAGCLLVCLLLPVGTIMGLADDSHWSLRGVLGQGSFLSLSSSTATLLVKMMVSFSSFCLLPVLVLVRCSEGMRRMLFAHGLVVPVLQPCCMDNAEP